jgi:hypothetical protein
LNNETIAQAAGVCVRTVPNALKRIERRCVIVTVDDASVGSRRKIVLANHPGAAAELAKLQASPHVRFERNRVGAPSDKSRTRLQMVQPGECIPCNPEIANRAIETVNRSNPGIQIPLTADGISPSDRNGERTRIQAEPGPGSLGDWRRFVQSSVDEGIAAPATPLANSREYKSNLGVPAGPTDDPIIRAELELLAGKAQPTPRDEPGRAEPLRAEGSGQPAPQDPHGANTALTYEDEAAMVEALKAIGPGSSKQERQRAVLTLMTRLRDSHSARFWAEVVDDVALGRVKPSVVMNIAGAGVRDPRKVITARVEKRRRE